MSSPGGKYSLDELIAKPGADPLGNPEFVQRNADEYNYSVNGSRRLDGAGRSGHDVTRLSSKVAIPLGISRIFIGGLMVITGILAVRYQSYLFDYGSGLWAGIIASISGMIGVTCTKGIYPKPSSVMQSCCCGGHRFQIHFFILSLLLSMACSVLLSIFSTTGLYEDAKTVVGVELDEPTIHEENYEFQKTMGIYINSVLLLLAMLEILLSFASIGIVIIAVTRRRNKSYSCGSLLSYANSEASDGVIRDILGGASGADYQDRKDRLLRWLAHQTRQIISQANSGNPEGKLSSNRSVISAPGSRIVALKPALTQSNPIPRMPTSGAPLSSVIAGYPTAVVGPVHFRVPNVVPMPMVLPAAPPPTVACAAHVPRGLVPAPGYRRSRPRGKNNFDMFPQTLLKSKIRCSSSKQPNSKKNSSGKKERQRDILQQIQVPISHVRKSSRAPSVASIGSRSSIRSKSSAGYASQFSKKSSVIESNREIEVTEEEVSKTYTGLDRSIAEDYIANSMK